MMRPCSPFMENGNCKPDYCSIGNIIIDDILVWDDRVFLNQLGGSGTYAVSGMRVWNERLGFVAYVGHDFSEAHREKLCALGVNLSGILTNQAGSTSRAWQIFRPDEERIEVFRTKEAVEHKRTPIFDLIPHDFLDARGFHIYWDGSLDEFACMLPILRSQNPGMKIVMEPATAHLECGANEFQKVLPMVDLFSPNTMEGEQITGKSDPLEIVETFLKWGAPLVSIRMGKLGSLVKSRNGEGWHVPAVVKKIVDVTGAGNAYCGGFLVGLGDGLSVREAALRAAVSASFAIEQFSVPVFDNHLTAERTERLALAEKLIQPL
jgi:sugar/nucleoside kinase (ribokinase family)